ncbi:hypothetical protein [Bacillus sp. Hm123]|uniref:hypothetical protein n=1 Tax=Bacillus sp. Hm123 TaxID=3450745 RepID=UPI003F433E2F
MSNHICRLLEETPPGTAIRELMMNGEDISTVEEFVKYDRITGLAFFTNKSNSVFVAIAERIDMIEFEFAAEEQEEQEDRG